MSTVHPYFSSSDGHKTSLYAQIDRLNRISLNLSAQILRFSSDFHSAQASLWNLSDIIPHENFIRIERKRENALMKARIANRILVRITSRKDRLQSQIDAL